MDGIEEMIEIKILFKNGECAYYTTSKDIDSIFELIGDAKRDCQSGIIQLEEICSNKQTLIDIQEIATFGYSMVAK
ncbi:hypothetical protein E4V42_13580 [Clostridium estertheticum]|uniref:Uncharacterized protein n=2 Tax=Clostridium estertheticum TaxID=238834 RepID=A0A1J0GKQ9_9CLOT|nr:hypothetical protein [Clostridium estertheticum]APC41544.1 hypothetical protein A7L45_16395 [Clostridium estertheticum subsp. estertheticum]MPQ32461.1 hypothetical protein [Clostridium estertheticum]MPQ63120.1 hypothetical protein [Clostridium estertheticum]